MTAGIVTGEKKPEIDVAALKAMFPIGATFKISGDSYYFKKVLRVVSINNAGVVFEDDMEAADRACGKTKHCFNWVPLDHFVQNGLIRAKELVAEQI